MVQLMMWSSVEMPMWGLVSTDMSLPYILSIPTLGALLQHFELHDRVVPIQCQSQDRIKEDGNGKSPCC